MRIPLLGGYRSSKRLADLWREYLLFSVFLLVNTLCNSCVIHVFLQFRVTGVDVINHENRQPRSELGSLRHPCWYVPPLRQAIFSQFDSLRAICKEIDDPKRYANRHVQGQQLPSEKRVVYQIERLPVIE